MRNQGREIVPIVRDRQSADEWVSWDTSANTFDAQALGGCDAVVHLAGESVMGRWSAEKKQRIHDSRVKSTRALAQTLAGLESGPRTLIVASAIGIYGDTGQGDARTEDDPPAGKDRDFLADVCVQWEAAADPARQAGIRVVHVRIGIVLSPKGGALKQMLLPFKLGLGGRVGSGTQWMSWIGLHDLTRVFLSCLDSTEISGPVNAVAPQPVTNTQFTKALGRVLKRPALLPVPAFAIRLLYGKDCADATALSSIRVAPKRLQEAGFVFDFADLDAALSHELGQG